MQLRGAAGSSRTLDYCVPRRRDSFFPRPQPCRCGQRRDSIPIAGGGGHGLVQPIFSAPSRLCRPDLLSTTSSRDATLKMLSILELQGITLNEGDWKRLTAVMPAQYQQFFTKK